MTIKNYRISLSSVNYFDFYVDEIFIIALYELQYTGSINDNFEAVLILC
jgi:hypothetical protein